MTKDLPVWRSMLFVPVTQRRFVEGAARRGADAIILDLEDSVAASEKDRARTLVPEAAGIVARGGADVVVRINRPLRMAVRDIEAAVGPGVLALALPKTDSAEHVQLLAEIVDEVEAERGMAPGTTRLIAMVETTAAFFRIAEIARAHPRLCALNLGAEDFATSAGILPEAEALSMPKQMAVFAARAAGIMPMGFIGSIAEFHDLDAFRQTIRRSRRFGFIGASVIHPSQIAILNEEFRPGAAEVEHAGRVVAAYDQALAEGVGAVTVDDRRASGRPRQALTRTRSRDRRPRGEDAGGGRRGGVRRAGFTPGPPGRLFGCLVGGRGQLIELHPEADHFVPAFLAHVKLHRVGTEILQVDRLGAHLGPLALVFLHRNRRHLGLLQGLGGRCQIVHLEADVMDAAQIG